MYLNASVHCLFCHPHSDGSLGNRNERELDADDINKTSRYMHNHESYIKIEEWPKQDMTNGKHLKVNNNFTLEDQFSHHEEGKCFEKS